MGAVSRAVQGAEVVYLLAAYIDTRSTCFSSTPMLDVNVSGCVNVINACLRHGVRRLIYCSSVAAIWTEKFQFQNSDSNSNSCIALPLDESAFEEVIEDPFTPRKSMYGASKACAEYLVRKVNSFAGLHTICLRPQYIIGPGDRFITERILKPLIPTPLCYQPDHPACFGITTAINLAHAHVCADAALGKDPSK